MVISVAVSSEQTTMLLFGITIWLLIALGIGVLVALVVNRKTRPVGLALGTVPVVLVIGVFWMRLSVTQSVHREREATAIAVDRTATPYPAASIAAAKPSGGEGRVIEALGRAIGQALESRPAPLPQPHVPAAGPLAPDAAAPSPAVKPAAAESPDDVKLSAMADSLTGAVFEELPKDMDKLTALRLLGRYLGRAIAAEQARTSQPDAAIGPGRGESVYAAGPRPAWVDAPPGRVGDAYQMAVATGPYLTVLECEHDLPGELQKAVAEYAELYLGPETRGRILLAGDALMKRVVRDRWEEPIDSIERMVRLHVRLEFDSQFNDELKSIWRSVQVNERIKEAGVGLGAAMGLLGIAFGLMKLDVKTKGAWRKPAGVLAGIFVVVGSLAVFWWAARATAVPVAPPRDVSSTAPPLEAQDAHP